MKTIDRIILSFIAVGLWTSIFMFNTHPRDVYAFSIDAHDIDGLTSYILNVVNGCTVSGDIYIYDGVNGDLSGAYISC